ncbi:hypothetical protein Pan189_03450 [Stratiformator vulcanicus]|uniref:Uncharacterized protein n=1 Tax=Stratiformator vulcanicus TaxID=2527980 RepID=A0A517QWP1_9PLAN|nr:hypothetical protein Pan189_03450 [Stratiformator vulcanicus]
MGNMAFTPSKSFYENVQPWTVKRLATTKLWEIATFASTRRIIFLSKPTFLNYERCNAEDRQIRVGEHRQRDMPGVVICYTDFIFVEFRLLPGLLEAIFQLSITSR